MLSLHGCFSRAFTRRAMAHAKRMKDDIESRHIHENFATVYDSMSVFKNRIWIRNRLIQIR